MKLKHFILLAFICLSGCSTISGIGKDITSLGNFGQKMIDNGANGSHVEQK